MASPNMATFTASLERSLQNCSLNHQHSSGVEAPPPEDDATPTLELNSESPLPYPWEQCLDLKTAELYYINRRTGMKTSEDPRTVAVFCGANYYSEGDSSSYDSGCSSPESSPSSTEQWRGKNNHANGYNYQQEEQWNSNDSNVLVVGGCKSCLMYYMVPKQLEICPKCCAQLLHFD